MGYREANAELDADLVLYNTCTIGTTPSRRFTAIWDGRLSANAPIPISLWSWLDASLSRRVNPCSAVFRNWTW